MSRTMQLVVTLFVVVAVSGIAYSIRMARDGELMSQRETPTPAVEVTPTQEEPSEATESPTQSGDAAQSTPAAVATFSTEAAAQQLAKDGRDVVYFFSAAWCPICQRINRSLENPSELARLKDGTTIVRVDYDNYSTLRQKYGVTYQTTFVRIDGQGNLVKKATLNSYNDLVAF
jgi:thiol-disulfide isomerase/thioredoxin